GVHARGLQVGPGAVAPDVVRAGEGGAVLPAAADARPGRILHREGRSRAGGVDGDHTVVEAVAGAVAHQVDAVDDLAGTGVDVDDGDGRGPVGFRPAEPDLPHQAGS